jgi:tetratricopeptide (TPR) repeat protein
VVTQRFNLLALLALALGLACGGCSSAEKTDTPDDRLEALVHDWEAFKAHDWDASASVPKHTEVEDVNLLRHRFEMLSQMYPNHVPILVANGIVAYDCHMPERAAEYLDRALSMRPVHAEAAMLRARIASEEGDLPHAKKLLTEQIRFQPDHFGLREAKASVLFELGQLDEARVELDAASRLGAPAWRVQFNLGLIEEAAGRFDAAERCYAETVKERPEYDPARSRLRALEALPHSQLPAAQQPVLDEKSYNAALQPSR